jgi:hypothetical protein
MKTFKIIITVLITLILINPLRAEEVGEKKTSVMFEKSSVVRCLIIEYKTMFFFQPMKEDVEIKEDIIHLEKINGGTDSLNQDNDFNRVFNLSQMIKPEQAEPLPDYIMEMKSDNER